MMRAFRIFALIFAHPWLWRPVRAWENEDAVALTVFLNSKTGRKLVALLRNASVEANANAAVNSSAHLNGTAAGVMAAIRYIESFSRPVPAHEDDTEEAGTEATDILEHLRP